MTLNGILEWVDTMRPNPFSPGQKTAWVNDLEASLWHEIFLRPMGQWRMKDPEEDGGASLLLPDGWRRLYEAYLLAMMEFSVGEFGHYESSMARYNGALAELGAWYAETYDPARNPARWVQFGTVSFGEEGEARSFLGRISGDSAVLGAECRVVKELSPGCTLSLETEKPERLLTEEHINAQMPGVYRCLALTLGEDEPEGVYLMCRGESPEQGKVSLRLLLQLPAGKGGYPWK